MRSCLFSVSFFLMLTAMLHAAEPQRIDHDEYTFAHAVATAGTVVVVGVPGMAGPAGAEQGAAIVHVLQDDEWIEAARLTAADGQAGDRFGFNLATDGEVIIVSAPHASVDGLVEAGAVHVFQRASGNAWDEVARLTADDPTTMANFGASLAVDNGRLVVGAPFADAEFGEFEGAAYVFDFDAGAWRQAAKLNLASAERFGESVDVSGDLLAASDRSDFGTAHVYRLDDSQWVRMQSIAPAANGYGGIVHLCLEDDVLAIAAPGDEMPDAEFPVNNWQAIGLVHVFELAEGAWEKTATLESASPYHMDQFGHDAALNDGLLVAANGYEGTDRTGLFLKDGEGDWQRVNEIIGHFPRIEQSLAVSSRTLVTGGPSSGGGFIHLFDTTELLAADDANGNEDASGSGDASDGDDEDDNSPADEGGQVAATGESGSTQSSGVTLSADPGGNETAEKESGGGVFGSLLIVVLSFVALGRRGYRWLTGQTRGSARFHEARRGIFPVR